jgi:O-antigen/teichoic acid export membrane protein
MTTILNKIATGGGLVLAGILTGKVLNLLTHIFLTRKLSLKEYGVFALVYSFFMILSRVSLLGIPTGLVRFCSAFNAQNEFSKTKNTIKTGFTIVLISSSIVSFVLLFFNKIIVYDFFKDPDLKFCLIAFTLFIPIFNQTRSFQAVIRAFKKMAHYAVLKEMLFPCLFLSLAVFFLTIDNSLSSLIYAFGTALILTFSINLIFISKLYKNLQDITQNSTLYRPLELLRFSLPVLFVGVSYLLLNQLSKIMIGFFQVSENVGIFNAAMNIGAMLVIFLNCIDAVFAPYISELHATQNISQLNSVFKTTARWVFTLTVPLCLLCILFSKNIMSIFGAEYISGYYVLIVLSIGYTINSITGSVAYILQMSGKQDIELFNMIIAVFINLLINYLLIPEFGIVGAALATGVSIAVLNIIRLLEVFYFFRIQPYDLKYIKPLLAVAGSTIIVFLLFKIPLFLNVLWIIKVMVFSISYLILLIVLKFEDEDRNLMAAIVKYRKA